MTTQKTNHRAQHCAVCQGKCPTPQACEVPEDNRFDRAVGFIRDVLAGVGVITLLVIVCFTLGRTV